MALGAGLLGVERGVEVEDGLAALVGDDPPGREGPPVTDPVDRERHGRPVEARPQVVGPQRVHVVVGAHRGRRRSERLAGHLTTEQPPAALAGRPSEAVPTDPLDIQQVGQSALWIVEILAHPPARPQFSRSTTVAMAMPPAAHMVSSPHWPSWATRSWISVVMMRAPVMPKGWPRAMAPPWGLSCRSMSMPVCSHTGSTWAAKASLSSTWSKSPMDMPVAARTLPTASMGATPMISGLLPEYAVATIRASGVSPSSSAFRRLVIMTAAAPSLRGQLLPA